MEEVRKKPVVAREEEPRGLDPIEGESARVTRRRKGGRSMKCFSEWIKNKPIEKWALIADTNGSRYGIMTTNLAEVYNWVLKACRSLPLVANVECILRDTVAYLRERFQEASIVVRNPQIVYCSKMTEILDKISAKGTLHRVEFIGKQDFVFEVTVRDKGVWGSAILQ